MNDTEYVVYRRVSTDKQETGIEAQERAIQAFLASYGGSVLETYTEYASGAKNDRVELNKALKKCRKHKATLLVAKLDRVSRRVSWIAGLMESSINLRVAELPNADEFQLHIYASLAQQERRLISDRTKAALQVLKLKGIKLGSPLAEKTKQEAREYAESMRPYIEQLINEGIKTTYKMSKRMNEEGKTSRNGSKWS
ncbi:MAG: recombinase family protein, partial [Alphaproteobacteria bacterium]|nr:recombinase family protein [Alphaproteobacteria bacterium]